MIKLVAFFTAIATAAVLGFGLPLLFCIGAILSH